MISREGRLYFILSLFYLVVHPLQITILLYCTSCGPLTLWRFGKSVQRFFFILQLDDCSRTRALLPCVTFNTALL